MIRTLCALAIFVSLAMPALAGEPVSQTFAAPPDKMWTVATSVLKQMGWDVEKSDQAGGWINTESRSVDGEDYGVYAKGTRHRLTLRLKPVGANQTAVSVERALFNRERRAQQVASARRVHQDAVVLGLYPDHLVFAHDDRALAEL